VNPFIVVRQASASYPVYVGRDLLDQAGTLVKPRGRVFLITSRALHDRFGHRVAHSFATPPDVIAIEEGESRKTLDTANEIVTHLLDRGAKRDSMAVVVGGGMLGDTAGFAAAIFLRGIDLVHVPTTLLAQVDSAIGGKVAVNHPRGKNLVGAFHPPRAVIADTGVLSTLPHREMLSGLFEALKGGVIGDEELFERIEARQLDFDDVVARAIAVKAKIVSADEKENDLRRLLNYGHTIGHGIEAAMDYRGMTHGEAVAWGMIAANAIALRRGLISSADANRIDTAIRNYEPTALPELDPKAVLAATEHDKKNTGSSRVMVFPRRIGECVVADVTEDDVAYGIESLGLRQR
jgi:3-dehydroquinate synthase